MTNTNGWNAIASIPDNLRDGRNVILWAGRLILGMWCDEWCDAVGRPIRGVTHYTDAGEPA